MAMHDDLFADAARQVLHDHCTPAVVRAIEAGGRAAPEASALWEQLEVTGLTNALLPENQGGVGLALDQVFGVLEQCGAHALPLPLADTMLARALLASCDIVPPTTGGIALARGQSSTNGGLRCALVRGGVLAASALVQANDVWRLLPVDAAQTTPQAFALDAAFTWTAAQVRDAAHVTVQATVDVRTLQAAAAAAQMAGALMAVFQRTLQYANERQQFGRPIAKFQAIQHQLAVMGEHVFAARMAAQIGCSGSGIWPDRLRVATAKCHRFHRRIRLATVHAPPACLAPDGGQRSVLVRRGGRSAAGARRHDAGHRAPHHRHARYLTLFLFRATALARWQRLPQGRMGGCRIVNRS